MLPESLVAVRVRQGLAQPGYLGAADLPWLRLLLDERERFVGRPVRALMERLAEPPPVAAPEDKRRVAVHVLLSLGRSRLASAVPPARARETLFLAASARPGLRQEVLASAAAALGLSPDALVEALFADVPGERRVAPLDGLTPEELAVRCNLALAQGLLQRSHRVELTLLGNARALVRQVKLRRLICKVTDAGDDGRVRLDISGARSLFHHTLVYGRALAEMVPLLAWCRDFHLQAECVLRKRPLRYVLRRDDPIFPAALPRLFDGKLEARLARDLARAAPDWEIVREPMPVRAGSSLVFPDFLLVHRADRRRQWLLELVGYHTPESLEEKLRTYRDAALSNLILAVDESLRCAPGDLPAQARVLFFRRRVDVAPIVALLDGAAP